MTPATLPDLFRARARLDPDRIAIIGTDRTPLSYRGLSDQIETTGSQLAATGIATRDRVAIVLPNGPEMAVAFAAVASHCASAPLNPAYREEELEFYLTDLAARAVVTTAEPATPARRVARRLGIRVLGLVPDPATAGRFELAGAGTAADLARPAAGAGEVAMVLHTSGTTSRPKIVPLTHRNLCASAANITATLALGSADRCLNVMPLFHIHGLMAAVLATLSAGASVVCTPGFLAPRFFPWLAQFRPTWYTAVPTMHQAIVERAGDHREILAEVRLRFLRSSSAALPPSVLEALEAVFRAPMVEAYGMTEASHQMACNPLPPKVRKPGSVGPAAGPEVRIMDEVVPDLLLEPGAVGEVVIRGANVTPGYAGNPEANATAFTPGGWFRTGDQGYLDGEGYLFITGRLKEIINRGGEKISPREIDEVLLRHPAVAQAVTFAMPDRRLGEDVAAAVVVRDAAVTEGVLRRFVATAVADFKVPRRIVIVDEIPKGPTGKLQRIGLAERLGIGPEPVAATGSEPVAPRTDAERTLAALWCEVLGLAEVGVETRFLDAGGDSVLATRLLARVGDRFGVAVSMLDFFEAPTIAMQALLVESRILDQLEAAGADDGDIGALPR